LATEEPERGMKPRGIVKDLRGEVLPRRDNCLGEREEATVDDVVERIIESVLTGDSSQVESSVAEALREGLSADWIMNKGLVAAMAEVGARFERQEFYVPEMLVAARAMQSGLAIIKPGLIEGGVAAVGKVVLGTVKGDLHDIGKSLVGMMLEGAGFEVTDLGTDVPPARFAEAVREHGAQLVGLSALLTTTMQNMRSTIEALEDLGVRDQVRVMVGGAPVTEAFSKEIGADGYGPDASRAVSLAKALAAGK